MVKQPGSDFLGLTSLGFEIAIAVFLGAFLGYQADRYFHSYPLGMILGVVLGAAAGIWNAYKLAMRKDEHS